MTPEETNKSELAKREEQVLEFWQKNKIFEKTLKKSAPKGEFVFYDGPPTANGRPGIHHLEARAFKDAIPRYKTMRGYHVFRKAGWDTHGLPVELEVEKQLGLKSKKEIESYGIAAFNEKCKESVWKYVDEWGKFTTRTGYWVDQDHPYVTYYPEYIESVWNVVKQISDKGYLYKDYKVLPWCPRCGTALSSHELAQGYQDDKDLSVYAKFKIKGFENAYILAWTTTPWTLPGNVALAVGPDLDYVEVKSKSTGESYLLGKEKLNLIEGEYEIVKEYKGSQVVGLEYEPLYPFLRDSLTGKEKDKLKNAFKVYPAGFVTTTDGTGIVHTAVMYGADDFELGTKVGLPKHHMVNDDGTFKKEAGFLAGRFVKDEETAVEIIKDLAHRGLLFKKEKYEHSYPHCWRCKTPLIYFARDSWYISMSKLRDKLVKENESINWEPEHIKEGRFGEWLREIKDWAISRERYWGTPLPVWNCEKCHEMEVIGSIADLKARAPKAKNNFIVMRHGQAENNISGMISSEPNNPHHLTEKGKEQARAAGEKLKDKKIDMIFVSPFVRTKETADIVAKIIGLPKNKIISDERIREVKAGTFNGKPIEDFHNYFSSMLERFTKTLPGGENYSDMRKRVGEFLYDVENKYEGKNILIITHDSPQWLLKGLAAGKTERAMAEDRLIDKTHFSINAVPTTVDFSPLPHNENFELDLHKPFIDDFAMNCKCGGKMKRVKEVMDVWFDSGAMPFAQEHYPFSGKKLAYPADFISEGIDQTRGWFYTLHAVGILLGRGKAYKNVICLGHLMDAKGKKMSKSLGNGVDPWEVIEKYGTDVIRFWMYSINQPGESKNFDEKTVVELRRKVFDLLDNVISFYELYRDTAIEEGLYDEKPSNILDKWILAKLNALIKLSTENMDNYKLIEPARAIKDFIGDLSTWYLRRSRDRIKDGDAEAKRTLYFILKNLAKLMAPLAPFTAEAIWLKLRVPSNKESIHLTNWPEVKKTFRLFGLIKSPEDKILKDMEITRGIVSRGLEARQKAGIKVRQPLSKLTSDSTPLGAEYLELIKDELNVKEVIFAALGKDGEVSLDTHITPELKDEGDFRELVRAIQDMRKIKGFTPSDKVSLFVDTDQNGKTLLQKFEAEIKKSAGVTKIELGPNDGEHIDISKTEFRIKISK
jgi:isoleucyl-tRNA synthetase